MEMRVSGDVSAMIREANEQAEVGKVVALECGVFTKGYGSGMKPWGALRHNWAAVVRLVFEVLKGAV